jgi:phenylalanine-4-hydroxylase
MKSPITYEKYGSGIADLVVLDPDHPGFRDPVYRARRNEIAKIALEYEEGDRVPAAPYTEEEHVVWNQVWNQLAPAHDTYVCRALNDMQAALPLDRVQIPQLSALNQVLMVSTGYRMEPVAGLVVARTFLARLGRRIFLSTQYIRHFSKPMYTPEPDIIHELIGHAASLAHPGIAEVNQAMGIIAEFCSETEMARIESVYWYTMEFGAALEQGEVHAVGAGLLSSFGELQQIRNGPTLLDWDLNLMAQTPYDPTEYQPQLFVAPSFDRMLTDILAWLDKGRWRDG